MRVQKKHKQTLVEITSRLAAIRLMVPGGRPGFPAGEYSLLISILESAIDFNPIIPNYDRPGLLKNAVSDAAKEPAFNAETLHNHLARMEKKYLAKPLEEFVLASALGIEGYKGLKTIRINGVRIALLASLPRRFGRGAIAAKIEEVAPDPLANVVQVLARISARTPNAAFYEAQNSVDLIRALWNFVLNAGKYQPLPGINAPLRPVNAILPGSIHTLHRPGGALIPEIFWFEPRGFKGNWVYAVDNHWLSVQSKALKLLSRLRSLRYREEIENMLIRYVRALDDADPRSSFNRIWGVLEYLTDCVGSYDVLIRRASFLSLDSERLLVRMLLQHLRDVRNTIVHADEDWSNIQTYLDQVKMLTERLMMFHLRNGGYFGSRVAAAEFLDNPTDRATLRRRMCDYRRAINRRW